MYRQQVVWHFTERVLSVEKRGVKYKIRCEAVRGPSTETGRKSSEKENEREQVEEAHQHMITDIEKMGREEAEALVRPSPKKFKNFKNKGKRIPIKELIKKILEQQQDGEGESKANMLSLVQW